jgi:protein-disulfide isomerase
VYFGDYACLYCLEQINMIKEVIDDNEDINLIWKDYPEDKINSNSWQGALAGRCAQSQNKFWEFLDLYSSQYSTFNIQNGLSQDQFNNFIFGLAEATDLNMRKFKSCYNNLEHSDVLASSIIEARALKLPGVPYTYINDRELLGEFDKALLMDEIKKVLDK